VVRCHLFKSIPSKPGTTTYTTSAFEEVEMQLLTFFPKIYYNFLSFKWLCVCVCVCMLLPSVLWHCWLGVSKSIQPVKTEWWGVGVVICPEVEIVCIWVQLMPLHPKNPSSLASLKSGLVLPFWYRLTQVVLEKTPLNSSCVHVMHLSYSVTST